MPAGDARAVDARLRERAERVRAVHARIRGDSGGHAARGVRFDNARVLRGDGDAERAGSVRGWRDDAGVPADQFVSPYPNMNAARAANGGAYPPDLSLITKARGGGADYLYSLLIGYKEAPKSIDVKDGLYYNKYYSGNLIAMPQPIYADGVEYADGSKASIEQMAADVTEFLVWAAEPEMEVRKRTGIAAISFLIIMSVLSYLAKQQIWANVKKKQA